MLVREIHLALPYLCPALLAARRVADHVRVDGGDHLQVGMHGLDARRERIEARVVFLAPVLVADADRLERKRRGMPHLRAERAPRRVRGAADELHGVQHVRDEPAEVRFREELRIAELARAPADKDGERFRADVLAEDEILVEAEPHVLVVSPDVPERLARLGRAHGALPVEPSRVVAALQHATAGEAEVGRLEVGDQLRDVLPETVSLERLRGHEAHVVDLRRARLRREDQQVGLLRGGLRRDGRREFLPCFFRKEVLLAEDLVLGGLHAHDERHVAARVERKVERHAALHVHLAHRARVAHARERRERLHAQVGGRIRLERLRILEREASHAAAAAVRRPAGDAQVRRPLQPLLEAGVARRGTKFEPPVPHELGVEAAVHG